MDGILPSNTCQWWSAAFSNGFWVFVGIISGTSVTLLVAWILTKLKAKKIRKNLVFEISFNIKKIQEWKMMLDNVLEESNSENIGDALVFFDFQKIILWTLNKIISDGTVYDYIDEESIASLQKFGDFCSLYYSQRLNDEIKSFKETPDKAGVAKMVRYWKGALDQHESALRLIESKL